MEKKKTIMFMMAIFFLIISGCSFSRDKEKDKDDQSKSTVKKEEDKNQMGINLWGVAPWAGVRAFVDIMKESRPAWVSVKTDVWTAPNVEMDNLAYPKTDAAKIIWEASVKIEGIYSLVFTGKAENIIVFGLSGKVSEIKYDEKTNKTTAKVEITSEKGTGGLAFKGTRRTAESELETGITDVHLYRPGYPADGSVTFTNEFIAAVRKFQCVRFIDWNVTNGNPCVKWEERTLPENSSQFRKLTNSITTDNKPKESGVAYEYMIQLCNEINSDLWINVPINADDDFIASLAKLIHYGRKGSDGVDYKPLNQNLKVYVEYGNEIWNTSYGFYNYGWVYNLTLQAQKDSTHPIVYDGKKDIYLGLYRYVAWKTVEISNIFRREFGDNQMMTRVRPVLESQLANTMWLKNALEFMENYYSVPRNGEAARSVNYFIYGGGGSAYYGVDLELTDVDYVINHHFDEGVYPSVKWIKQLKADALIVKDYGLKRVAYEGGPGLDYTNTTTKTSLLTTEQQRTINANIKMKDMIIKCQNAWSENSGDLLCYYVLGAGSPWEFTSDKISNDNGIYSLTTPKMLAIEELNNSKKADVTFGNTIPGEIIIREMDENTRLHSSGYNNTLMGLNVLDGELYLKIAINNKNLGKYKIVVNGRMYGNPVETPEKGVTEVKLNGENVGTVNLPINGMSGVKTAMADSTELEVSVPKGLSVIRLTNKNRFSIYSVKISEVKEVEKNKLKKNTK